MFVTAAPEISMANKIQNFHSIFNYNYQTDYSLVNNFKVIIENFVLHFKAHLRRI